MSEKIAGSLDTPNPGRVEERLRSLGADVGFLRWLYDSRCPTYVEDILIPLADPKPRYREWKKLRRRLQKANKPPEEIREMFRLLHTRSREELHERVSTTGLHEITSVSRRRPRGRPGKKGLWIFVWLAKAYMERITGSPRWSALAQMAREWGGESYDAGSLRIGWEKNKSRFTRPIEWNVEAFLDNSIHAYSQRLKPTHSRTFLSRTLGALDRYAASRVDPGPD